MSSALTPDQERALELLRTRERFLLVGHVRPDGDCLGAQAALWCMLKSLGKEVHILNPDPPDDTFRFLSEKIPFGSSGGEGIPEHDVCVLLDISELSRCGGLAEPLRAAPSLKLVIDHHVHPGDAWWDAAFVDVGASATGLLIWRLAKILGYEGDNLFAHAVFTSLATDTGWFKYSNTDVETFGVAAELVAAGVVPFEVFGALYQTREPDFPGALGDFLTRATYHGDGRIAVVDEPLSEKPLADTDPVLDILRAVACVEVVLYFKELEGGVCKLSARSKTAYDVNALARRFGGGGHVKASGATIEGSLAEVRERVTAAALEALD